MQTCLLFLPFPHSKGSTNDVSAFTQLFQNESSSMLELSRVTKIKGGALTSFRPYIRALSTRRGSQIQAVWTDPFNPSNFIPSRAIESEIAATIWNYVVALHNKILQTDSSNVESLKEIKKQLEEINACNTAFEEILGIIQHPVFTPSLAHFMKLYNNYISSYWQLSCIITLKEDLAPTLAVRCLEDIKMCENYMDHLNPTARNYFLPAIQSIRAYVESYSNYRLSFLEMKKLQYGVAISYLQRGIDLIKKRKDINAPYATSINMANKFLLNALTDSFNKIDRDNKNIYRQVVPNTPALPKPYGRPEVGSTSSLLCAPNEVQSLGQNISSSTPNFTNIPNQIPGSNAGYATYTNSSVPYPGPQSNYPSPPTISYPTIAPAQLPPAGSPKPPQPQKPSQSPKASKPSQPPKKSSEPLNTTEWDIVCALKKELLPRIKKAMASTNPNIRNVAQTLIMQFNQASQIDPQIQDSINKCQADPSISPDTVNPYIKQADVFYTQLEERLNILERTGR